jgi:hypothetical protein
MERGGDRGPQAFPVDLWRETAILSRIRGQGAGGWI